MARVLLLVAAIFSCCVLQTQQLDHSASEESRYKRSDDSTMQQLEVVVNQLTQRLTTQEAQLQAAKNGLEAELRATKNDLQATKSELQAIKSDLQTTKSAVQALQASVNTAGSTFVRWGKNTCPANTVTVYPGYAAGSLNSDTSGGANHLCLTNKPVISNAPFNQDWHSALYGTEYDMFLNQGLYSQDMDCAVCKSAKVSTVMIPGTNVCPANWVLQYSGYLAGNSHQGAGASDYICVDDHPEGRPGSSAYQDGVRLYHTVTVCGSLPCPPYVNNKVVPCAICSQ